MHATTRLAGRLAEALEQSFLENNDTQAKPHQKIL